MSGPFKMKGSPMQRNFGVGSPLHQERADASKRQLKLIAEKNEIRADSATSEATTAEQHAKGMKAGRSLKTNSKEN